jgi:hemoglobin
MKKLCLIMMVLALAATVGCGGAGEKKKDEFFTSGSREADQRAQQRMARDQQLSGTNGKGGSGSGANAKTGDEERKLTLFERLGGDAGVTAIVDDFTTRALADPRVNWEREGVKDKRLFGRDESATWNANPQSIATLKKHLAQFIALATGGPSKYGGKEMRAAHAGMKITNPEFDAAVGDLKASLDKLQIPTQEQKELLAIIESTRPQIVTER